MPALHAPVLLVGESVARLELDLMPYGFTAQHVDTASAAVAELKQRPWPIVLVGAALPDMAGAAFVDGLLRHFEPSIVVLVGDVDPNHGQHLAQSPKVRLFPESIEGVVVADHIYKRTTGTPATPTPPPPVVGPANPVAPPGASLAQLFDAAPRTQIPQAAPGQGTPASAFAMPPPTNSINAWPTMPAPGAPGTPSLTSTSTSAPPVPTRPNTTMPFFAALGASPPATSAPRSSTPPGQLDGGFNGFTGTGPQQQQLLQHQQQQIEQAHAEIARSAAEVASLRARLAAAEQLGGDASQRYGEMSHRAARLDDEVQQLRAELIMARAAAVSDVAEIEALDVDDGAQLDELRVLNHGLSIERDGAMGQLELMRAERDRWSAEVEHARRLLVEAHADVEQHRAAAEIAEQALTTLDGQLRVGYEELTALRAENSLLRERDLAASTEREQLLAARADEIAAVGTAMAAANAAALELEAVRAEKADVEAAWAAEQQRVVEVEARLAEVEAAHLDGSTHLQQRIGELEAVAAAVDEVQERLTEVEHALAVEQVRAERALSDASALRTMFEAQTHEQARIVGEIEQLRPIAAEVDRARATVVDMQRQLEAALGTDERDGDAGAAIEESVRARTRELLELARAIEPFTWGLQQATAFFSEAGVDGATRHLQAMTLLQKTLERLKNELDRLHGAY